MRCPACAADNAPASKFCGVCGSRLAAGPPTVPPTADVEAAAAGDGPLPTAATSVMAAAPAAGPARSPSAGAAAARPRPSPSLAPAAHASNPGSLGGSLALPEAAGARIARLAIVVAIDVGLVIGGLVLATRERGPVGGASGQGSGSGSAPITGSGSGSGSGVVLAPTGERDAGGGHVGPGPGSGPAPGRLDGGAAAIGLDGGGRGPVDAAAGVDAAAVIAPVDAAVTIEPGPVDAAAIPIVDVDAAATIEPGPVDAAAIPVVDVDAAVEAAVSAAEIVRQVNHLAVGSVGRLDRCYQSATKVLPADQPLRGQVDIGLAVLPTGAVTSVSVLQNTTGSDQLGQCVQAVVESWVFSAHDGAEPVHVSRTFSF